MRANRFFVFLAGACFALSCFLSGCGPSQAEREAQQKARFELEERSNREADLANKAITSMNQKLGRKPPALNLGVAPENKIPATSQPERKP